MSIDNSGRDIMRKNAGRFPMKKYAIAYAVNNSLPLLTEEDLRSLTHINLAFGVVEGEKLNISRLIHMGLIKKFREWNPDVRVVLSVGGWSAGGFSEMAMTKAGRESFAQSCLETVERCGLDGIDIDWEYPCSDQAGIGSDPKDKENFTLLLQALRDKLGLRLLSIAAGAGEYFTRGTEMEKVSQIVDYVQIMTYDMRGGFAHEAGHHAALRASREDRSGLNTVDMVGLFHRAGVPVEKLVIGAAFYSRRWSGVKNWNNGLLQRAESVGEYGPAYSEITPEFIRQGSYQKLWDEDAQAAYLWNGETFISYESPEAIALKCRYVKEAGLAGIMYWEHGCDCTHELLQVIGRELSS